MSPHKIWLGRMSTLQNPVVNFRLARPLYESLSVCLFQVGFMLVPPKGPHWCSGNSILGPRRVTDWTMEFSLINLLIIIYEIIHN